MIVYQGLRRVPVEYLEYAREAKNLNNHDHYEYRLMELKQVFSLVCINLYQSSLFCNDIPLLGFKYLFGIQPHNNLRYNNYNSK